MGKQDCRSYPADGEWHHPGNRIYVREHETCETYTVEFRYKYNTDGCRNEERFRDEKPCYSEVRVIARFPFERGF